MSAFNLNKLQALSEYNFPAAHFETDTEADIFIVGFIEMNAKNPSNLCSFAIEICPMVSRENWLRYCNKCLYYTAFSENHKELVQKTCDMIHEIGSVDLAINTFSWVEVFCRNNHTASKMLKDAAATSYNLIRDNRFSLFRDYAYIYGSCDDPKLISAVNQLYDHLQSSVCKEDKRCIFYLLVLALYRLALLRSYEIISEYALAETFYLCWQSIYELGFWHSDEETDSNTGIFSDGWHSIDEYLPGRLDLFSNIVKYNCPEAANIFCNTNCYYDGRFLIQLHEAARQAIEENRYSSEKPPIISQKFVFLSNSALTAENTDVDEECTSKDE